MMKRIVASSVVALTLLVQGLSAYTVTLTNAMGDSVCMQCEYGKSSVERKVGVDNALIIPDIKSMSMSIKVMCKWNGIEKYAMFTLNISDDTVLEFSTDGTNIYMSNGDWTIKAIMYDAVKSWENWSQRGLLFGVSGDPRILVKMFEEVLCS